MFIPINAEIPKFECSACGKCCSHIRGMMPHEDKEFLKEHVFGKLPVFQAAPIERMTFPLWDWEAKRFREWQNEANVEANIKSLRVILDLNSNKAIILSYFMDTKGDACHFLKDNKCSIYHTKRAYVCRLFPFNRSPFTEKNKDRIFGECGAMEKILPIIPENHEEMIRFLNQAFPDGSFINAVQNDIVIEWSNKVIVDLMKKKMIRPAMSYPYDLLMKRFANAEKIDFTDFLTKSGYMTEKDINNLIERFDNNEDALEKINPLTK